MSLWAMDLINKQWVQFDIGHISHYSLAETGRGQPSILNPYSTLSGHHINIIKCYFSALF